MNAKRSSRLDTKEDLTVRTKPRKKAAGRPPGEGFCTSSVWQDLEEGELTLGRIGDAVDMSGHSDDRRPRPRRAGEAAVTDLH